MNRGRNSQHCDVDEMKKSKKEESSEREVKMVRNTGQRKAKEG